MNSLRVALLTPTFWPVTNRLLGAVRGLAERCQQTGAGITVFTEKLEPDWSSRLRFRDWEVVRVERPASRPWSRNRFGKALLKALGEEPAHGSGAAQRWDAVIVCAWPEALFTLAPEAGRFTNQLWFWFDRPLPPGASGKGGLERAWQLALGACKGLLSPHPRAAEWVAAGSGGAVGVTWLPDAVGRGERCAGPAGEIQSLPPPGLTPAIRETARKTLSEIHPLLNFERNQVLAVCAAELAGDPGIHDLLNAWRFFRRDEPRAQLLLVGDGPQARGVWSRVHDWHLQGNVVMPGCFDDQHDLLRAADFYIHPLRSEGTCPCLSSALQLGTPCILSNASHWSAELRPGGEAWIFEAGSQAALLANLRQAASDSNQRRAVGLAGAAAARRVLLRAGPSADWLAFEPVARLEAGSGAEP